jgi:hypothetical protein
MTKEQRVHKFISDTLLVTNKYSGDKVLVFLESYCDTDKYFTMEEIEDIIISRLSKNQDENKYLYILDTFRRIESHIYVKEKIIENAADIKESLCNYFMTCLVCPETFGLQNDYNIQYDYE